MSEPRVSDDRIERALRAREEKDFNVSFHGTFVIDLLQDLKDARAQLHAYQNLRDMNNKEPE